MKIRFNDKTCQKCGENYDPTLDSCPTCGERSADFDELKGFSKHVKIKWYKQMIAFLVGWLGFQIVGATIQGGLGILFSLNHPEIPSGDLPEAMAVYLLTPTALCIVNSIAYLIILASLIIVNVRDLKRFASPFKNYKSYLFGLAGFAALLLSSMLITTISKAIDPSFGVNENQQSIVDVMKQFPAVGFIVFGLFGPICEEITYRVGLFSFLSRIHKALAYAVTILVFAFIHFGWTVVIKDPSSIGLELLNMPSYLVAGGILCLVYDKFGFGASVTAHITYNILACIEAYLG